MKKNLLFILLTCSLFSLEIQYSTFGGMSPNRLDGYQKKFKSKVFIETGTHKGESTMVAALVFDDVYSIELSEDLFNISNENLKIFDNVHLINGDTEVELKKLLDIIGAESTFFFLDAHWSGGETVKGEVDPPVLNELELIGQYAKNNTVVLVNDMRCFKSGFTNNHLADYPHISEIKDRMMRSFPIGFKFVIIGDQAFIYNPNTFRDRISKGATLFTDLFLETNRESFIKLAKLLISVATVAEKKEIIAMADSGHPSPILCALAALMYREKMDLISEEMYFNRAKDKGFTIDF